MRLIEVICWPKWVGWHRNNFSSFYLLDVLTFLQFFFWCPNIFAIIFLMSYHFCNNFFDVLTFLHYFFWCPNISGIVILQLWPQLPFCLPLLSYLTTTAFCHFCTEFENLETNLDLDELNICQQIIGSFRPKKFGSSKLLAEPIFLLKV